MIRNKKIWIITEHYFPCGNTTSYLVTKISEGLAQGFEVHVITSTATKNKYDLLNGVTVHYVKDSKFDKNLSIQRILRLMILGFRLFLKAALLIRKEDTVIAVTNPASIVFLMGVLQVIKGFRLVFLVHDVFPENLVVIGLVKNRNLIYKITLYTFNWAYRRAEKLIVIGRDMADFMSKKLRDNCPQIEYVPNFADTNEIFPIPKARNALVKQLALNGKCVILFTGNIGRAQDIENILQCMKILKKNAGVHLLMIGEGAKFGMVEEFIQNNNLTNITLLHAMDRKDSNLFLNAGDIGLVSLQKNGKGIGIPSKTYSYLAAGKPLLGVVDRGSEVEMIIKETNCGWWAKPGHPNELANLIGSLCNLRTEILQKSQIARELAENRYALEKVIPKFKYLFNEQ